MRTLISTIRKTWIPLILVTSAYLAFVAHSPNFSKFSSYTLEEPHPVGPTWQAAAQKKLTINVANVYSAPVMTATSQSGLLDSFYIRTVSFFTWHEPLIVDPEFADATLQWFLILKRGVFCLVFLLANYFLQVKMFRSPLWVGLFHLAFVQSLIWPLYPNQPEPVIPVFQLSTNSEATLATHFLFTLFLYFFLNPQKKATFFHGVLAGALAPIRLQVAPFALLSLNSVKAFAGFAITALLLLFGLFTSSNEFTSVFRALSMVNDVQTKHTFFGHIIENIKFILWIYPYLLPLAVYGVYQLSRPQFTLRKGFYLAAWIFVIGSALLAKNSQARYFTGMHGAYLTLCLYGLISLTEKYSSEQWLPRAQKVLVWFMFVFFSAYLIFSSLNPALGRLARIRQYFQDHELDLTQGEKQFIGILEANSKVYVDYRVRPNLHRDPLIRYRDKIQIVDVFNDFHKIPTGAALVTVCYPLNDPSVFGLKDFSELGKSIERQCTTEKRNNLFSTFRNQNARLSPLFSGIFFEMKAKQPLLRKLTISKNKEVHLEAEAFAIDGIYIQEWEGGVRSEYHKVPDHFALRNRMSYLPGKYKLKTHVESRYRELDSRLEFFLNDVRIGECGLETGTRLKADSKLPEMFFDFYKVWRNKYYLVPCEISYTIPKAGDYEIKVKTKSIEPQGGARVFRFQYQTLQNKE